MQISMQFLVRGRQGRRRERRLPLGVRRDHGHHHSSRESKRAHNTTKQVPLKTKCKEIINDICTHTHMHKAIIEQSKNREDRTPKHLNH